MPEQLASPWNSLEIAKLGMGLLTPVVVALVGWLVSRQLARQSRHWQTQQRLADRRLQAYDGIRSQLNRIFCFVEDIGTWKEDNPETIIGYKRLIDPTMHSQRAIWAPDTFQAFLGYMDSAFEPYQGVGTDAKIRTKDIEKKVGIKGWRNEWSERLTGERDSEHKNNYNKLVDLMSRDLGLTSRDSS
jgi:hypothetical protein